MGIKKWFQNFVSSDSELILKIADKMKAYPLKRNKNLAKDSTSAEDLIKNL